MNCSARQTVGIDLPPKIEGEKLHPGGYDVADVRLVTVVHPVIELTAIKRFNEFTGGMNPMQVTAVDIEMFYDHLLTKVDRDTDWLKVAGLEKFFAGVEKVIC